MAIIARPEGLLSVGISFLAVVDGPDTSKRSWASYDLPENAIASHPGQELISYGHFEAPAYLFASFSAVSRPQVSK